MPQNLNVILSSKYCLFYYNCVCIIFVYVRICMHGFMNVVCTLFVHLWRSEDNLGCCCSPSTTRSLVQLFVRHDGSWNSRICSISVQEYSDYRHVLLCLGVYGLWGFKHRSSCLCSKHLSTASSPQPEILYSFYKATCCSVSPFLIRKALEDQSAFE